MSVNAITISESAASSYDDFAINLGVTDELHDKEREWLPARESHTLVVGAVGTGKTVLVQRILQQVHEAGWESWVADAADGSEFHGSEPDRVSRDFEEYLAIVDDAHNEMTSRYRHLLEGHADPHRPLLLVIDEPSRLHGYPVDVENLNALLNLGRSARIHVLITMQRPSAALLSYPLSEFAHRIGLGRLTPAATSILFGVRATAPAAENPGTGHILSWNKEISPIRVPAPTSGITQ